MVNSYLRNNTPIHWNSVFGQLVSNLAFLFQPFDQFPPVWNRSIAKWDTSTFRQTPVTVFAHKTPTRLLYMFTIYSGHVFHCDNLSSRLVFCIFVCMYVRSRDSEQRRHWGNGVYVGTCALFLIRPIDCVSLERLSGWLTQGTWVWLIHRIPNSRSLVLCGNRERLPVAVFHVSISSLDLHIYIRSVQDEGSTRSVC